VLRATVSANVTSFTDGGLPSQTTYSYRVRAYNAAGNSRYSNTVSGTTLAAPAPAAPAGLSATRLSQRGKISLKWNASAGATSYNVKRATVSGGPYAVVKAGLSATSYTDAGLTGGKTYYYVVTAVNAGGESGNSNRASATAK
jgi:fibronectin type 3 domain-containing protein